MALRRKIATYPRQFVFTKDGPQIAVVPSVNLKNYEKHKHDFDELVVVCSGEGTHIRDNEYSRISQGDVFFIPEGHLHKYESVDGMDILNIVYDHSLLEFVFNDLKNIPGYHAIFLLEPEHFSHQASARLHLNATELDEVLQITNKMQKELQEKSPGYLTAVTSYLLELHLYISRKYTEISTPSARHFYRLGIAMSYLEEHFCEQISIAELAAKAHLSERQFYRIFRKVLEVTPLQYQLDMRIKLAKKLLESTSLNITELAARCGFEDSCYFSKVFRQHTGIPPRGYRSFKNQLGKKTGTSWHKGV